MNKKSGFLTFCFALVPGAGQMYLGYMKRGCSFMLTLALLVTMVSTFSTVLFPLLVAVLWCFHLSLESTISTSDTLSLPCCLALLPMD